MITATPQLNMHYTNWVSENGKPLQHDCLRVGSSIDELGYQWQAISYCMNEMSPTFSIPNTDFSPNFTFLELMERNISSEQLYLWSAPIDTLERYQFFLNQFSTSNDVSLGKEIFYNCTTPRFGPMCQYELYYHRSYHSSFHQLISEYYRTYPYIPTDLTCYTHLNCDRGATMSCLHWSEICNGEIDCLNDGLDERDCWQLETNECKDDEYRCSNGQCIPQSFYHDARYPADCIDGSDEITGPGWTPGTCHRYEQPSIRCEDIVCLNGPVTTSCPDERNNLLREAIYSNENISAIDNCRSAFRCLFNFLDSTNTFCKTFCEQNACQEIIENTCPDLIYFPNVPILFGNVYSAYVKNDLQWTSNPNTQTRYICYNRSYFDDLSINTSKILFDNMACIPSDELLFEPKQSHISAQIMNFDILFQLRAIFKNHHRIFNYTPAICNRSNMYQCIHSSKCISIYRLMDSINDCPYMDDENITIINTNSLMERLNKTHFQCQASNTYIFKSFIKNAKCECGYVEDDWCEDEDMDIEYIRKNITFQTICDGITHLLPVVIEGRNETDETECDQWQCDNIYTRCDGVWNCPNGVDETGCVFHSVLNCSTGYHLCVSVQTNEFICLSIDKANDGHIDCLGGFDEQSLYRKHILYNDINDFLCINGTYIHRSYLCDGYEQCEHGDDEQFCTTNRTSDPEYGICLIFNYLDGSQVEKFLCDYYVLYTNKNMINFKIGDMISVVEDRPKRLDNRNLLSSSNNQHHCHRGLVVYVWKNNQSHFRDITCLCPPSYYGDRCQYQNTRISLTIKFRALANSWRTLFAIVISLIDDSEQRTIHSSEQFTYLSVRDCQVKFHLYLLYANRRKDPTKNYSIHIDIYEKISLAYRASLLIPVDLPFLPVHRLAFIVNIPGNNDSIGSCSNNPCIHGKCIKYSNNIEARSFCQCHEGWSGKTCTIPHRCTCGLGSLCIGLLSNNRSLCVCSLNKFGPRCLLTNSICENANHSLCKNGGHCIPLDDYTTTDDNFICMCSNGFSGKQCEIVDTQLILTFNRSIILSQSIFIHFFDTNYYNDVIRSTIFRTNPILKDSLIISWSQRFYLAFVELFRHNYYLIVSQTTYNQSTTINKMINLSDRCPSIKELFNETFAQLHLLRRIKYYHLPCDNQSLNLSCFYDDVHLCLCNIFRGKRLANCFKFDHNMTFDCLGRSVCENGGQCFQDTPDCPTRSTCICPECFYGRRCQFNTNKFSLSLDAILGYHISPYHNLIDQSFIVQFTLAVTSILMIIGLVDSVLCISTFKNESVHTVGCGLYLLCLSVTTLLVTILFFLKFWILLLAQTNIILNRSFLSIQCQLVDFLLGICLNMNQWLHSCVSVERAITVIKGVSFVKKTSIQAAKFITITLVIVITSTAIHDPIYRRLVDEEIDNNDEQMRTWCVAIYPTDVNIFDSILSLVHFFGPFILNLVSAFVLITGKTRQQAAVNTRDSRKTILRSQFHQHKNLLTDPIVSVILGLPRLIITYVSKCMTSPTHAWLYLIGYFLSLISPMQTFLTYVLPSKFYKEELRKSIEQYRNFLRRYVYIG